MRGKKPLLSLLLCLALLSGCGGAGTAEKDSTSQPVPAPSASTPEISVLPGSGPETPGDRRRTGGCRERRAPAGAVPRGHAGGL